MPSYPRYFYRVYDEYSVSQFDGDDGFEAQGAGLFSPRANWAKFVVARHMDWSNRTPSPFISVTDSREKANEYASQREDRGREDVHIAQIKVKVLRDAGVRFWHMQTLAMTVGAEDMIQDFSWNEYEWLCLHNIPAEAVVAVWSDWA